MERQTRPPQAPATAPRKILLGLAWLLAMGVSLGGAFIEFDFDGVETFVDNCSVYSNGPLAQEPSTPLCDAQEDADQDGYGNPCDQDTNNDGGAGLDDVGDTFSDLADSGNDPIYDFNCDGGTGLDDVGRVFDAVVDGGAPGPSGYACAGTIPCP